LVTIKKATLGGKRKWCKESEASKKRSGRRII